MARVRCPSLPFGKNNTIQWKSVAMAAIHPELQDSCEELELDEAAFAADE